MAGVRPRPERRQRTFVDRLLNLQPDDSRKICLRSELSICDRCQVPTVWSSNIAILCRFVEKSQKKHVKKHDENNGYRFKDLALSNLDPAMIQDFGNVYQVAHTQSSV